MYTKIVFETAEEFFNACAKVRAKGDESPYVPSTVYLILREGETPILSGDGCHKFGLAESISRENLILAGLRKAGCKVKFT